MPIRFACPQCGRVVKAGDTWAGKRAKCPGCAAIVDVPAQSTIAEADAPQSAAQAPPRFAPAPAKPFVPRAPEPELPPPGPIAKTAPAPQPAKEFKPPVAEPPPKRAPVAETAPAAQPPFADEVPRTPTRPAAPRLEKPAAAEEPEATEPAATNSAAPVSSAATVQPKPARTEKKGARPAAKFAEHKLAIASAALGGLGFLLFWVPFAGLAICAAGALAGAAAVILAARKRQWNIPLALAGLGASFIGGVIGYVVTMSRFK